MPKDNYIKEGWGLANQINQETKEEILVASDGSSKLKIIDPVAWKNTKRVAVQPKGVELPGMELNYINELEIIQEDPSNQFLNEGISNYVFAQAFHQSAVFMIEISSGDVVKEWEFDDLINHQKEHAADETEKYKALSESFTGEEMSKAKETLNKRGDQINFDNLKDDISMWKHYGFYYDVGNFVFNGIAHDEKDDSFFLTGKMWNHIYKVKIDYQSFIDDKYVSGSSQESNDGV